VHFAKYFIRGDRSSTMMSNRLPSFLTKLVRTFALVLVLSSIAPFAAAQLPASPPLADPMDTRFQDVTEDWTTPSLIRSNLQPVRPLDIKDEGDGYTIELLQVQWRWGDPLDLYVIKPIGVKNPPVILNLYGYPADTDPSSRPPRRFPARSSSAAGSPTVARC